MGVVRLAGVGFRVEGEEPASFFHLLGMIVA